MPPLVKTGPDAEPITAWQCVGCGKIEAPQPCVGVCRDRQIELVDASLYEQALARLERLERENTALASFVRLVACSTPRNGRWEQSYRELKSRAQRLLAKTDGS